MIHPLVNDQTAAPMLHQHFKMYKPAGVLSQFVYNHRKRKNRRLLGDIIQNSETSIPDDGIMAIGRLDEDSEGLLLLTTDGQMSKRVRERNVEKEYWVQVKGDVTNDAIDKLSRGVQITLPSAAEFKGQKERQHGSKPNNTYQTLPCKVRLLDTELVDVTKSKISNQKSGSNESTTRKRKFKGTCNKCGEVGHKTKDCPDNNIARSIEDMTMKMALPTGISPSCRISLAEDSIHGPNSWISITLTEGKNRQVRKMTHAVGHPCLRLVRVRIGTVTLAGMTAGDVKPLEQSEREAFIVEDSSNTCGDAYECNVPIRLE